MKALGIHINLFEILASKSRPWMADDPRKKTYIKLLV
jgi:hypothetical protein